MAGQCCPSSAAAAALSVYALRAAFGGCATTRACGRSPLGEGFGRKGESCIKLELEFDAAGRLAGVRQDGKSIALADEQRLGLTDAIAMLDGMLI